MQENPATTEGVATRCGDLLAEGGRIVELMLDGYLGEAWIAARAGAAPCWTALREAVVAMMPALSG
jgi:hypothetical protein